MAYFSGSNININLKYGTKNIDLKFSVSRKYCFIVHIKHTNNTVLKKGYEKILEECRGSVNERHVCLLMNFKEEPSSQLKEIKIIENPLCKIFEIDVTKRDASKGVNLLELPYTDCGLTEFEGIEFSNTIDMQSKCGKARHNDTTVIKTDIIKPMFLYKKQTNENAKVSDISNSIIKELNSLDDLNDNSPKIQSFMTKYSINDYQSIAKTIEYLQKNNDGGQIPSWCYQVSNEKL